MSEEQKLKSQPIKSLDPEQLIKIKRKNLLAQQYELQQKEDSRIARYLDVAVSDSMKFIRQIIGGSYKPKNDFTFGQKQAVLKYLYSKNFIIFNAKQKTAPQIPYFEEQQQKTLELKKKLNQIEKIEDSNRIFLINAMAECSNRIRFCGYVWGTFVASIVWSTVMKNSSILKRIAICGTIVHIGGQLASYRTLDRVFDNIYQFFETDLNQYILNEQERQRQQINEGFKRDEVSIMINETQKQIRSGQKIADIDSETPVDHFRQTNIK